MSASRDIIRTRISEPLTIGERLAQTDPGNTETQPDLFVSYLRLGDVAVATEDTTTTTTRRALRRVVTMRERLAQADPGDALLRRDLVITCGKMAADLDARAGESG